jgi:predicted nucleic acid-binding protein
LVVVDASFLLACLLEEPHTVFSRRVLGLVEADRLIAPTLLHWEMANVLSRKVKRSEADDAQAIRATALLDGLAVELVPPSEEVDELIALAIDEDLSGYDAAYLRLALAQEAALATNDQDLTRAAVRAGLVVHSPFA